MTLENASNMLRGSPGSEVTLEIVRPGISDPLKFNLIRQEIVIKDVSYAGFVKPGVAFIRISSFSDKAARETRDAIRDLQEEGQINSVILDLRGNPGGLLGSAVEVANIFVPKGELIVETRGNHEREAQFKTPQNALLPDAQLVVLVDHGSASAAEIVAGAIQDNGRGTLIGATTFGNGSVQTVDTLSDGSELRVTIARWYTPDNRSIDEAGITPDIEVESPLLIGEEDDPQIQRAVEFLQTGQ